MNFAKNRDFADFPGKNRKKHQTSSGLKNRSRRHRDILGPDSESSRPPLSISVFKNFLSIFAPKTVKNVHHCKRLHFSVIFGPIPFCLQKGAKNEFVDAKFLRAKNMDLKLSKSGLRISVGPLVRVYPNLKFGKFHPFLGGHQKNVTILNLAFLSGNVNLAFSKRKC